MKTDYKKWFYLVLLSLIWGSSYILIKKGLIGLTPLQLGSIRILFTLCILFVVGFSHLKKIPKSKWQWIAVSGFLGTFFPNFLFAYAETKIDSAIAAVLNGLTPLFTLLLGLFFFGIALKTKKIFGVLVGLFGTCILVVKQIESTGVENGIFLFMIVIAALCYAANVNIIKYRLGGITSLGIALGNFVVIGIPAFFIALDSGVFQLDMQLEAVTSSVGFIFVLAFFGTAMAKVVFNELVAISSPVFSSSITYLLPVVAIFWGVLDGEQLDWLQFLASGIILGGVYLVTDTKKSHSK